MRRIEEYNEEKRLIRARKRVDELKSFYKHLSVFLVINIVISIFKIYRNLKNGESFEEAFFDFNTFSVWTFWGIGLAIHALSTFGFQFLLGKDWEQRKIDEYLKK